MSRLVLIRVFQTPTDTELLFMSSLATACGFTVYNWVICPLLTELCKFFIKHRSLIRYMPDYLLKMHVGKNEC